MVIGDSAQRRSNILQPEQSLVIHIPAGFIGQQVGYRVGVRFADRIAEPVPLAAVRLLDADRWAELRERCISRIDDAIQRVGEDSQEQKALQAQKQRLSGLVSSE